jgi:hypothetical protein
MGLLLYRYSKDGVKIYCTNETKHCCRWWRRFDGREFSVF